MLTKNWNGLPNNLKRSSVASVGQSAPPSEKNAKKREKEGKSGKKRKIEEGGKNREETVRFFHFVPPERGLAWD